MRRRLALDVFFVIVCFLIGQVEQEAHFPDRRIETLGDQGAGVRTFGITDASVNIAYAARERPALLQIQRTTQFNVHRTTDTAFDLVGRTGLVDLNGFQQFGRNVIQRRRTARAGGIGGAVQGRLDIALSADHQAFAFAACAGNLDAGDVGQGLDDIVIRQLADVFGIDGIDDLLRFALAVGGRLDTAADAFDDDDRLNAIGRRGRRSVRCGRLGRGLLSQSGRAHDDGR